MFLGVGDGLYIGYWVHFMGPTFAADIFFWNERNERMICREEAAHRLAHRAGLGRENAASVTHFALPLRLIPG